MKKQFLLHFDFANNLNYSLHLKCPPKSLDLISNFNYLFLFHEKAANLAKDDSCNAVSEQILVY